MSAAALSSVINPVLRKLVVVCVVDICRSSKFICCAVVSVPVPNERKVGV